MNISTHQHMGEVDQMTGQVFKARVQACEYIVNAFPDWDSPNAVQYQLRVVRHRDGGFWEVFDNAGFAGYPRRLGPDGQWSMPPDDPDQAREWWAARRYTMEQALELAKTAAPHMEIGPQGHRMNIAAMLAWEKAQERQEEVR